MAHPPKDPKLLRNVPDRAPTWVLDGLIAKGCVSMIAAPMSMHKTNVGVWVAKEASTGSPLALDRPNNVWLNEQEGDISMQVRPRLMVSGADPDRVTLTMERWSLPRDLDTMRGQLQARETDLLILDSVQTHIPGFTSTGPAVAAMEGLVDLALDLDIAILLIHHFTKSGASSVRTSIGGAGVLQNLSRGAIFVIGARPVTLVDLLRTLGNHAEDANAEQFVMAALRSGISKLPESLLFEVRYEVYKETQREEVYLHLVEPCDYTADQVFKAIKHQASGKATDPTQQSRALAWLLEALSAKGPMPVNSLIEEAKAVGIAKRTLERARADAKDANVVEVIRPEDLREALGHEQYDGLDAESRKGFWLTLVDIGEPPIDEWSKEV